MLKKILTLAMAAALAVSMVACGNTASKPTATPKPVDLAAFGEQYVTAEQMPPCWTARMRWASRFWT